MKTTISPSFIRTMFFALLAIGLSACASPGTGGGAGSSAPSIQTLKILITAATDVNPDLDGRPSPVILHLLEMTSTDAFNRADFFTLTQKDDSVLGGELLNKTEIILTPGSSKELELEPGPQAAYLGFVAAYRDIDNARWRVVQEITPGKTGLISILVEKQRISVSQNTN